MAVWMKQSRRTIVVLAKAGTQGGCGRLDFRLRGNVKIRRFCGELDSRIRGNDDRGEM
jgi:hypothetical protein